MNYTDSITDFFKSPKWMMNLLLGGVCVLIPIVGSMVVLGWPITGFWARRDQSFETFPNSIFPTSANIWSAGCGRFSSPSS